MSSSGALPELDSTYGCLFLIGMYVLILEISCVMTGSTHFCLAQFLYSVSSNRILISTGLLAHIKVLRLWALSCLQLWFYIEKYMDSDKLWLKLYTILLWILSTLYLILVLKFLYIYFIKEFGNVAFLDHLPKDIYRTAPFSPVICTMVQALFVMRAWNLSNNNYFLTGFLACSVIAQLVLTIIFLHKLRNFDQLSQLSTILGFERAMNILVLFTDTVIALTLIWLLWRRRSGFKKTEGIIRKLVAFTIGTGLITGVMAIVAFIAAQTAPQTFVYLLIDYCMAKLYYNCMLASLNARSALRSSSMNSTAGGLSIHLDDLASTSASQARATRGSTTVSTNSYGGGYKPRAIECRVDIDINSGESTRDLERENSAIELRKTADPIGSSVV
ncbi:hypothetical protein ACEPAH_6390 [Sanghuangporus vaninii]